MGKLSAGAVIAWQIAGAEARAVSRSRIEREHLMIGLCSLQKALSKESIQRLGNRAVCQALGSEAAAVDQFCDRLKINTTSVRRELRRRLEKGESKRIAVHLDYSEDLKDVSRKAADLARRSGEGTVTSLHLLVTIFMDLKGDTAVAVHSVGADPSSVSAQVAEWVRQGELIGQFKNQPPLAVRGGEMTWLSTYGRDLTQDAKDGKLAPLIGRRNELLQVIRTLGRRTKKNPVLIGEPGVGKTAIVHGLAHRIAAGKVLQGCSVIELSPARLVAGTKYRGEFEERLTGAIEEAKASPDVVLFFDEIRALIGAGAAEGNLDAAEILKPYLANGELRCIGATTLSEYRAIVEKDAALERRLQPVMVTEPSSEETKEILNGLKSQFESYHGVEIESDTLAASVDLTVRYVSDRQLPDKALDALDEACSYVRVPDLYMGVTEGLESLTRRRVTREHVAEAISAWTGIPVKKLTTSEAERLLHLEDFLRARLVGQNEAVARIAGRIRMARSGLTDERRPLGVFLFVGPTGVGKTELAKLLAEALFGSQDELIRIDMTEFQEKHSVSKLLGSPPGYLGHQEEGLLIRELRARPFSVVLLDEIDKADHDVLNVFLQVFDDGRLTDAKGRTTICRHALYAMTANTPGRRPPGFNSGDVALPAAVAILAGLRHSFPIEFLNRVDEMIVFGPLTETDIKEIARRRLEALKQRLLKTHEIALQFGEDAIELVGRLGYRADLGARELNRIVERMLQEPLIEQILSGKLRQHDCVTVQALGEELRFHVANETQ